MNKSTEATPDDANHSLARRIGRPGWNLPKGTEMSLKNSGKKFYGLMRQRLTFSKVMERRKFGERKDLLMIPNIQAHL